MSDHVLLNAEAHRDLRIRRERSAELGDGVMTAGLVLVGAAFVHP